MAKDVKDLELFENKIIILYILNNSNMSLTLNQIVKFCEDFDDITYFDICTYIENLLENDYIEKILEDENTLYKITASGECMLKELLEFIPGLDLYNIKKLLNKNIAEIKTDNSIYTTVTPIKSDEYKISCCIKDGNYELINISLYAGHIEQARNISKNWAKDAENIYDKLIDMLTKD